MTKQTNHLSCILKVLFRIHFCCNIRMTNQGKGLYYGLFTYCYQAMVPYKCFDIPFLQITNVSVIDRLLLSNLTLWRALSSQNHSNRIKLYPNIFVIAICNSELLCTMVLLPPFFLPFCLFFRLFRPGVITLPRQEQTNMRSDFWIKEGRFLFHPFLKIKD